MEGGNAIVKLQREGSSKGWMLQTRVGRTSVPPDDRLCADFLHIRFDEKGVLKTVNGEKNAKLLAREYRDNRRNSDRLDLEFAPQGKTACSGLRSSGGAVLSPIRCRARKSSRGHPHRSQRDGHASDAGQRA